MNKVGRPLGTRCSEKTKERMSKALIKWHKEKGYKIKNWKVTDEDVVRMRELFENGNTKVEDIAKMFNISKGYFYQLIKKDII